MPTISANLPDVGDYLRGDFTKQFKTLPPAIVNLVADTTTTIYITTGPAAERLCDSILIRNLGAAPITVCFDDDVAANKFHDVIGYDSVGVDKGFGGTLIVFPRRDTITKISVMAVGGAGRLCMTKRVAYADMIG